MTTKPKTIAMSAVKSNQIAEIGHDGDTLAVRFQHGGTLYHYHGVSPDDFAKLQAAESMGSHLHQHIKGNFEFSKIEDPATEQESE
jgi:hypothetical protein